MASSNGYFSRVFTGTLVLVLVFGGVFLAMGQRGWARGVALGGAASLVNLILMAGEVRRQLLVPGTRRVRSFYGSYALRMTVLAAALIYSASNVKIALWATIPFLFASQFVMTAGEVLGGKGRGDT